MKVLNIFKDKNNIHVVSGDKNSVNVKHHNIWKRFLYTWKVANVPYLHFVFFIILSLIQTQILIKMPQVNADFFTGDASVKSITMFLVCELTITVVCQIVLYVQHLFRSKTNRNLRNVLWKKILHLKPKYYDKVSPNTLLSRITLDTECFNTLILDILWALVSSFYMLTLTIHEMSEISLKAAFVLLVFVPISILLSFLFGRINVKFQNSEKYQMSNLTEYLSELMASLPLVKSFNSQAYEIKRGEKVVDEYYSSQRNLIGLDILRQFISTLYGTLPEIVIIMMGIKLLNEASMDAAGWYIFYIYSGTLLSFAGELGGYWEKIKTVQGQLYTISQVLYEEEEGLDHYINEVIQSGDISFDSVSFTYDGAHQIFDNITFTIPKNKTTAIVGYSGTGKSTILKFMTRLYEPTSGRIFVEGKNLNEIDLKSWREKIAYVSQDSPMISGTLKENLLYGIKREVNESEIHKVLQMTYLDEFVNKCPNGLDYEVGQFGSKLSGGQKQKVAIARAIISKPEILILDEPTASLDILSTNEIASVIQSLNKTMTIVIVAHHSKMVMGADHIIVLNKDKLVEGSHDELMATNDYYQCLMNEEVTFNV